MSTPRDVHGDQISLCDKDKDRELLHWLWMVQQMSSIQSCKPNLLLSYIPKNCTHLAHFNLYIYIYYFSIFIFQRQYTAYESQPYSLYRMEQYCCPGYTGDPPRVPCTRTYYKEFCIILFYCKYTPPSIL